jgi:hypothetical protein
LPQGRRNALARNGELLDPDPLFRHTRLAKIAADFVDIGSAGAQAEERVGMCRQESSDRGRPYPAVAAGHADFCGEQAVRRREPLGLLAPHDRFFFDTEWPTWSRIGRPSTEMARAMANAGLIPIPPTRQTTSPA